MLKKTLALVGLSILTLSANAALTERDYLSTGDALLTYDSSTGAEWLDLTVTSAMNMSVNQLIVELSSGGMLEGFRYATNQEVTDLFLSLGGNTLDDYNAQNFAPVNSIQDYFGATRIPSNNFTRTQGFTGDSHPTLADNNYLFQFNTYPLDGLGEFRNNTILSRDTVNPSTGHFLLRETSVVPVPAAAWLFGSALLGLVGIKRRK